MRTPKNTCLIQADKNRDVYLNLKGGIDLILPSNVKKFNEYRADIVTQNGIVAAAPSRLRSKKKVEVKNNDTVYGHHFMCRDEKKVVFDKIPYYANDHDSIYCKVDDQGHITMVGAWNFVVPIYPPISDSLSDSGLLITHKHQPIPNLGKIIYPSSELISEGVKEGDIIMFVDDCEYEILIGGKMFYRIRSKYIIGIAGEMIYQMSKH
jgi:co-chaperonin GroES (HSP10)